jgi:kinesin family protein 18/19
MKGIDTLKTKKSPKVKDIGGSGDNDHIRLPPIKGGVFSGENDQHNEDLKSAQNNILVAVRARPINAREESISNFETIRILDGKIVVALDPQNQFDPNDVFRNNRNKEKQYAFDFAFDHTADTATVFENTTKFLIPGVLSGFNATVFAYGPTGTGKTFTMLGGPNSHGIMFLTLNELFIQIKKSNGTKQYAVKISYLEVYNETIRDLLADQPVVLDLREDASGGNTVAGLTEVLANTPEEVMEMLTIGSKNRIMEPTAANTVSSRSHAVLQVTVEHRDKNQGIREEVEISKLSLIDLAGSERAANTNNRGQRMIEGANINRSLLALGNCITLLGEQNEKGIKHAHIPYRDSKLTRILKDSLGGNCRTVMIANISPGVTTFEDTLNTLKYANRAKNIKTAVHKNVLSVEHHVENYAQIISNLKQENENLKQLLQNKDTGIKSPTSLSPTLKTGSSGKDALIQEIEQHFDGEMRLKKKIFSLETQYDEVEEKLVLSQSSEDKGQNKKLEESLKQLTTQLEELKKEYGQLGSRRGQLQARIHKEKNQDALAFLTSVLKQNQINIDNLDLLHREKRIEGQVKLKDKQIKLLQNQITHRDGGKVKEPVHPTSHSLSPQKSKDTLGAKRELRLHGLTDDMNPFSNDLNNLEKDSKVLAQQKLKRHFASVLPKSNHINANGKKVMLPRVDRPFLQKVGGEKEFYFNKQDFLIERAKPFEVNLNRWKPKKRQGYKSFETKVNRFSRNRSNNQLKEVSDAGDHGAKGTPRGISTSPHRRKSLSETSFVSDNSSPDNTVQKKKRNILSVLNKKDGTKLPKLINKGGKGANGEGGLKSSPFSRDFIKKRDLTVEE